MPLSFRMCLHICGYVQSPHILFCLAFFSLYRTPCTLCPFACSVHQQPRELVAFSVLPRPVWQYEEPARNGWGDRWDRFDTELAAKLTAAKAVILRMCDGPFGVEVVCLLPPLSPALGGSYVVDF